MRRRSEHGSPVACAECGQEDVIQIELTLPDGTEVTFNSCHRCEHRWWESESGVIDLNTVLEKARKQ